MRHRAPIADHRALAQTLAQLGQSRLSSNLNQIAKAAHLGALDLSPGLEAELWAAREDVREMRTLLMTALGRAPDGGRQ